MRELNAAVNTWISEHPSTQGEAKEVIGGLICDIFISLADGEGFPSAEKLLASQAINAYPTFYQRRQAVVAFARLEAIRMGRLFDAQGTDYEFAAGEVCSFALTN